MSFCLFPVNTPSLPSSCLFFFHHPLLRLLKQQVILHIMKVQSHTSHLHTEWSSSWTMSLAELYSQQIEWEAKRLWSKFQCTEIHPIVLCPVGFHCYTNTTKLQKAECHSHKHQWWRDIAVSAWVCIHPLAAAFVNVLDKHLLFNLLLDYLLLYIVNLSNKAWGQQDVGFHRAHIHLMKHPSESSQWVSF